MLSTGTACGIGAAPIPFSDIAPLLALEAGMAASLAATYGVEMEKIGLSQVAGINTTLLGIGASFGYLTAQMLKCIPVLYLAGAAIDVTIAGYVYHLFPSNNIYGRVLIRHFFCFSCLFVAEQLFAPWELRCQQF